MCGIAGIMRMKSAEEREAALMMPPTQAIPEKWLNVLDNAILHRGPDGHGRFRDRTIRADGTVVDVALVHRRLSIIDPAGGDQPMVSSSFGAGVLIGAKSWSNQSGLGLYRKDPAELGRWARGPEGTDGKPFTLMPGDAGRKYSGDDLVAVVFNGCIYNHRALRGELRRAGHVFSTDHSDTEVLVHGWREWREGLLAKLEGMYAAVIWDRELGELVWMRDEAGEKPLYRARIGQWCVFASTAAGVLKIMAMLPVDDSMRINSIALRSWTRFGWGQELPIERIECVPIGSAGLISGGCIASMHAHDTDSTPTDTKLTAEEVDQMLDASVESRLETDVPIGCFLSGGIDSALVTMYARKHMPNIEAFTVRMPSRAYDESEAAGYTAAYLGVKHRILECDAQPGNDLTQLIPQLGLPFGDSSLLPTTWVSRAARKFVRVALTGDGGDELFMGYQRHAAMRWMRWLERLPADVLESLLAIVQSSSDPKSVLDKARRLINATRCEGYEDLLAIFPLTEWEAAGYAAETRRTDSIVSAKAPSGQSRLSWNEWVARARRIDRYRYLPEDLLRKTDTAAMSCGLETRAPMLARELSQRAFEADVQCLMPGNRRKGLLKEVARRYLPREIVDRPKMGFAIPIGEWLRTDFGGLRTLLMDGLGSTEPFGTIGRSLGMDIKYAKQMAEEHLGTGKSGMVKRDHAQRLYMVLVLMVWGRWLDNLSK